MTLSIRLVVILGAVLLVSVAVFLLKGDMAPPSSSWGIQPIASDAKFRGLCAVSPEIAWVGGTNGTFGRTTDGGRTWSVGKVPGAEELDFRDVEAFGESTAYLLSAGPGDQSRIYKTIDGGATWTLQFKNADPDPASFFDAIAFWDERHGIALGDPVGGRFQLIATDDGTNWKPLQPDTFPAALPKEGAFAASGTCLVTRGENEVWFATGGLTAARLFHSSDRGRNWTVRETPIRAGTESSGIFSIGFRDRDHGVIVGGDYKSENDTEKTVAVTIDGGKTWTLAGPTLPYRSGIARAKDRWVAVGPSGSSVSFDDGATWKAIDGENYNAVGFTSSGEGWAVGPGGRIAKFLRK